MHDQELIALFWERNQDAIRQTEDRYGSYCQAIAMRILNNRQDAEECVQDTWLRAWQAMPPQKPDHLRVWLGTITRRQALKKLEARQALKRGGGFRPQALDELAAFTGHASLTMALLPDPHEALVVSELAREISTFLRQQPPQARTIFIGRYVYLATLDEIAAKTGLKKSVLSLRLHRMREALRNHLIERGYQP